MEQLTHVDTAGHVRMVDVSAKPNSVRHACARGRVRLSEPAARLLRTGSLPKGDGLAVARVAAITAVKRTPDIIPLCHPINIDQVEVGLEVGADGVDIEVTVTSVGRTGAEMEALTGVTAAALTIIDMVKAVDRGCVIEDVRVVAKSGGRSGSWNAGGDTGRAGAGGETPVTGTTVAHPCGYVIVSDRRHARLAEDETGPLIARTLSGAGCPRVESAVVPDDVAAIGEAVLRLARAGCRVIVTSGGTGIGPRDVTPEALSGLIDQPMPGLTEALRALGGRSTAAAWMSRQVAGIIKAGGAAGPAEPVLVVALPGSAAAVRDSLELLVPLFPHIVDQMSGGDHK